jgi:hypothetical protein
MGLRPLERMALLKFEGQNGYGSIPRLTIIEMLTKSIKITFVLQTTPSAMERKYCTHFCRTKSSAGQGVSPLCRRHGKRTMRETEVLIASRHRCA